MTLISDIYSYQCCAHFMFHTYLSREPIIDNALNVKGARTLEVQTPPLTPTLN